MVLCAGCSLLNKKDRALATIKSSVTIQENVLYPIEVNGKYGYINRLGKVVVKPQYNSAEDFSEGFGSVCKNTNKNKQTQCGFVNVNGQEIIPLTFTSALNFSEGLSLVSKDEKYFYINKKGEIAISNPKYSFIEGFSEGLAPVEIENKWGFIDRTGNIVIKPKYDMVGNFHNGLAMAGFIKENDNWVAHIVGYLNKNGKFIIKPESIGPYQYDFNEGVVAIQHNDMTPCEFKDTHGKVIFNIQKLGYNNMLDGACVSNFYEGLLAVNIDYKINKWGYINKEGKLVFQTVIPISPHETIPEDFYYPLGSFSEGLATYYANGKYGYLDKRWNIKIKTQFDEASGFYHDLASVKLKNKYGYIDKTGKFVWYHVNKERELNEK